MSVIRKDLCADGAAVLRSAGIEDSAFDAQQLMLFVCDMDRTQYLLRRDEPCTQKESETYASLIERRRTGEPLQYILHSQNFLGREYAVGPGVLIPRPETEELVLLCADRIRANGYRTVFDLCAGSGCIGLSIAALCADAEVYLIEKYEQALYYLRNNISDDVRARVHVIAADIVDGDVFCLPKADLIVSNPPYISSGEIASLQREVHYEPVTALDGGTDGMDFFSCIRKKWISQLRPGGFAAFECGEKQGEAVCVLFRDCGKTTILKDAFGMNRFVTLEL